MITPSKGKDYMKQIVLHVAYGMNSDSIPSMSNNQLVAAFFMADKNMPSIRPDCRKNIRHNMALIADEMSDRLDKAKRNRVRIEVPLMCMKVIVKRLYEGTVEVL
jgi:hypothetical protein